MAALLALVTRKRTLSQIRQVAPVAPRSARGLVADVYRQVERDFGMLAPPVSLHASAPPVLAAAWMMLRESLVASGQASRSMKELVAAAVSWGNQCPYCVDVHGSALLGLLRGPDAQRVAAGHFDQVADPGMRALAEWARDGRGAMPYPEHRVEHIAVAVAFHYYNRMVNIFLPDSPLPPNVPTGAQRSLRRVAAGLMGMLARPYRPPGASLELLPEAPAAADLSWTAAHPTISAAFARAAAAVDAAGTRTVPEEVRRLVAKELGSGGAIPRPDRSWLPDTVAALPPAQRPAGRLALLTALASHTVTGGVIEDFRRGRPDDAALVEITAWASLAAARHAGAKLADQIPSGQSQDPAIQ